MSCFLGKTQLKLALLGESRGYTGTSQGSDPCSRMTHGALQKRAHLMTLCVCACVCMSFAWLSVIAFISSEVIPFIFYDLSGKENVLEGNFLISNN